MNKKKFIPYFISLIGIFVLSPPYFAYGIIMLLTFNIVYGITIYFSVYLNDLEEKFKSFFILLETGIITVLIHLLIRLFSPVIGITISFVIYLIPLEVYSFNALINKEKSLIQEKISISLKTLGFLNIIAISFSLIREFIAFSSISIPTRNGITGLNIPINIFEKISFIGSTVPGILLLSAIIIMIIQLYKTQKKVYKEESNS